METALDPRLGRYFFPVLAPAVEKRNSHRLMTIIVMVIQYGAPTIREVGWRFLKDTKHGAPQGKSLCGETENQ